MPRTRAQRKGRSSDHDVTKADPVRDFGDDVKRAVAALAPDQTEQVLIAVEEEVDASGVRHAHLRAGKGRVVPRALGNAEDQWMLPRERFAEAVLAAARWAFADLDELHRHVGPADLLTECEDTVAKLDAALVAVVRMSPGLLRSLPPEAGHQEYLRHARDLRDGLRAAGAAVKRMPPKPHRTSAEREIAIELASRVMRVAEKHGMSVGATWNNDFKRASPAVELMRVVGDALGLKRSLATWRNLVLSSRK